MKKSLAYSYFPLIFTRSEVSEAGLLTAVKTITKVSHIPAYGLEPLIQKNLVFRFPPLPIIAYPSCFVKSFFELFRKFLPRSYASKKQQFRSLLLFFFIHILIQSVSFLDVPVMDSRSAFGGPYLRSVSRMPSATSFSPPTQVSTNSAHFFW